MDTIDILSLLSMKMGVFMDKHGKISIPSTKRGQNVDKMTLIKKRHPRKDVSIFGVEQGGTVEKLWPPMAS